LEILIRNSQQRVAFEAMQMQLRDEMREQIDFLSEYRRGSQSITRHTWNAGELARPWDSPAKEFSR
jgi:hypothetical protein